MAELTAMDPRRTAREQQERGDLAGAEATLRDAIRSTETALADLYGMLGGTLRKQGDLVGAAAAYDEGFLSETRAGVPSTYNELNRIITRILLAPALLTEPQSVGPLPLLDIGSELTRIEQTLKDDVVGRRQGDPWAMGDLAIVAALNGDIGTAVSSIERFLAGPPAPSPHARGVYAQTVATLAALDTPQKPILEALCSRLTA